MSDVRVIWDVPNARGDWSLVAGDLERGHELETAILVSLFTDRIAHADDVIPDGTTDRRGWWGDGDPQLADSPLGSRLWLLDRAKQTEAVRLRARDYIVEALQWLIDDGVVARFDVTTEWTRPGMLGALVVAWDRAGGELARVATQVWEEIRRAV